MRGGAVRCWVSNAIEPLELTFDSEFPTARNPAGAGALGALPIGAATTAEEPWVDSEAPTGVAAERPLFPRPPRAPAI